MSNPYLDLNLINPGLRSIAQRFSRPDCDHDIDVYETILANLLNGQVKYSLSDSRYPKNRYAPFAKREIMGKLNALDLKKVIERTGIESEAGTTYLPSQLLKEEMAKVNTRNTLREPIIMRREKIVSDIDDRRDIEYQDSLDVEIMRAELLAYNDYMSKQDVSDTNGIRYQTSLRRIFNDSSFDCGGRFYGGKGTYQALAGHDGSDRTHRREILINGRKTSELDFTAIHLTLLLLREGYPVPEDPYLIAGFDRDKVKRTFNIAINAQTEDTGLAAVAEKVFDYDETEAARYYEAVKQHMGPLAKYLCSGEGIRLQGIDSNIAANVMRDCTLINVPVLVIHDSFRIENVHLRQLKKLMVKHFKREMLTHWEPRIK